GKETDDFLHAQIVETNCDRFVTSRSNPASSFFFHRAVTRGFYVCGHRKVFPPTIGVRNEPGSKQEANRDRRSGSARRSRRRRRAARGERGQFLRHVPVR